MTAARAALWWRLVLPPLLAARLIWLGIFLAVLLIDFVGTPLWPGIAGALVHWDAIAYLQIASSGYPAVLDYHDAFLPGFPLLVGGVGVLFRNYAVAAWVVNLVAEAVALWFIARLVLAERDRSSARFSVWLVALAPTAVFLVAPFTESPFIAAAAASLYYARQNRPGAAAIAAALAAAVRLTGLALIPALILEQLMRSGWRPRRNLLLVCLVPVPLLLYCAYMQAHTGDFLALLHAEQLPSFGQTPAAPWDGFRTTWATLVTATDGETRSIFAREVAFGLLGLLACVALWASTRIPRSFALYGSLAWLMTASLSFWRSEPRYLLALFPAVLIPVDLTSRFTAARPALLGVSAALMGTGTWIFAQGRWLG